MGVHDDVPEALWGRTRAGVTVRWLCLIVGICALVGVRDEGPWAFLAVASTAVAVRSLAELGWWHREWRSRRQ